MAMIQPVLGPDDSDAGTALGDGFAEVGAGCGAADVDGAGDGAGDVGVGEGDAAAYAKVMLPSTGWPSCDTTR